MAKAEFPSLFDPGWHTVTVKSLRDKCVKAFPRSTTRKRLMAVLETAIKKIQDAGFPCELWIDGSFLTEKIDPTDVDVAAIVPFHVFTAASAKIHQTLEWISSDDTCDREGLDGYILNMFPASSPMAAAWEQRRDEFTLLFCTKYDNVTPKGVAIMRFRGGASCRA